MQSTAVSFKISSGDRLSKRIGCTSSPYFVTRLPGGPP
ncbi:hypothetical protein AR1Y2_3302 [Anaerostipes rhamnosivorans]|uniref:Uncharacterized protein n=1 Tax=Anaerostipes rhamnosivorans TaxID=1229621 RepID=A0A4P8IH50_9FIRM|nr:hypothetical protein AR1Y2_3302 [Anaerostipes rhamnosivorans]